MKHNYINVHSMYTLDRTHSILKWTKILSLEIGSFEFLAFKYIYDMRAS